MAFREILPGDMNIMAVVKANGYGHGAIQIAQEVIDCGAEYLAVALLDEALELRHAGIKAPILVMGYIPPEGLEPARLHHITITAFSKEMLESIEGALAIQGKIVSGSGASSETEREAEVGTVWPLLKVHIKLDTGMGRLGVSAEPGEAVAFIERALLLKGMVVEGLYTHYASADETDPTSTYSQYERFKGIVDYFRGEGVEFLYIHAGNSAGAIQFPELSYNMVRLGISLYGLYPSEEVNHETIRLEPVMSFKTAVVMAKMLPPGHGVSYGSIYRTVGEEQIATLPAGYADGLSRGLTGNCEALIRGTRVPVVGRICMDQCMVNVSELQDVIMGEEVVLFGKQGEAVIPADEWARKLGTINYEVTCMVSYRVPKVYFKEGRIIEIINPLLR